MFRNLTFGSKVSLIFIFIFSTKSLLAEQMTTERLPGDFLIDSETGVISVQDVVVGSILRVVRDDGSIGNAKIIKINKETTNHSSLTLWSFEASLYSNPGLVFAAQTLLNIPHISPSQETFSPVFLIGDDGVSLLMWKSSDWNYTGKRRPIRHINRFNDWFGIGCSSDSNNKTDLSQPSSSPSNIQDNTTTQARPTDNSQSAQQPQPEETTLSFQAMKSLTDKINPFDQNMTSNYFGSQNVVTFIENKSIDNTNQNQCGNNFQTQNFTDLINNNPDIFPSEFSQNNISEKINNFGKIEKELESLFSQSNQTDGFNYQSEMRISSDGRAWVSASIIDELGRIHSTGWGVVSQEQQPVANTSISSPEAKLPVDMINEMKKTWNDGSEGIEVLDEDDDRKPKYNYPYSKEKFFSGNIRTDSEIESYSETVLKRCLIKSMSLFLLDTNLLKLKKKNIKKCQTFFKKPSFTFQTFLIQPRDWTFCKIALGIDDQLMPITEYEVYQDSKNIYNTLMGKTGTVLSKKNIDDLNNYIETLADCSSPDIFYDYVKDALKNVSITSLSGPTYNNSFFRQNLFKYSFESALEEKHKNFCINYRQIVCAIKAYVLQDLFEEIKRTSRNYYLLDKLIEKVDDRSIVYSLFEYSYDVIDEFLDNNFIPNYSCAIHKKFPTQAHKRDCLKKCRHNDSNLKYFIKDYVEVFKRDNWDKYSDAIKDIKEIIQKNKPVEETWIEVSIRLNQALPNKYDRAKPKRSLRFKKIGTVTPKLAAEKKSEEKVEEKVESSKEKVELKNAEKEDIKAPEKTDWESIFNNCFKYAYASRLAINVATDKAVNLSLSTLIATKHPYLLVPLAGSVLYSIFKTVKDDVEFVKETQIFKTVDGIKDICELKDFVKNQTSFADKTSDDVLKKMEEMQTTLTKQINDKINSDPKTKAQFESSIAKFKIALKSIDSKAKITNEQLTELTKSFSTFSDNIIPELFKTIESSTKYLEAMHSDLKTGQEEIKETVKTEATEIKETVTTEANEIKSDISKLGEGIEKLGDIVQIREKLAIYKNENLRILEKSKKYKNMTKEQAEIIKQKDNEIEKEKAEKEKEKAEKEKERSEKEKEKAEKEKEKAEKEKEKAEKEKFKNYIKALGIDPDKI